MGQNCAKSQSKRKISKNISNMAANVPSSLFNEKMRFKVSLCNIRGKNLNKVSFYFTFLKKTFAGFTFFIFNKINKLYKFP